MLAALPNHFAQTLLATAEPVQTRVYEQGVHFHLACDEKVVRCVPLTAALENQTCSAVCCESFGRECARPSLCWGAIVGICIGPLIPLPCVLWRISTLMKVAEESDVLLAKPTAGA